MPIYQIDISEKEPIVATSIEVHPPKWEYYMRRNGRYYFRRLGQKLWIEADGLKDLGLRYGQMVDLDYETA